jgi:hypothetical protein
MAEVELLQAGPADTGPPAEARDARTGRRRVRVSEATAWRYVDEMLEVLAAWAPGLHGALVGLGEGDFVIVDGTLIPGIIQACLTRQILGLADRAYQGAGATVRTPYYHHNEQPEHYQEFNRDHARLAGSRRTRRRAAEVLATLTASPMFHPAYRHRRPSHPHTDDLRLFRMKEVH